MDWRSVKRGLFKRRFIFFCDMSRDCRLRNIWCNVFVLGMYNATFHFVEKKNISFFLPYYHTKNGIRSRKGSSYRVKKFYCDKYMWLLFVITNNRNVYGFYLTLKTLFIDTKILYSIRYLINIMKVTFSLCVHRVESYQKHNYL